MTAPLSTIAERWRPLAMFHFMMSWMTALVSLGCVPVLRRSISWQYVRRLVAMRLMSSNQPRASAAVSGEMTSHRYPYGVMVVVTGMDRPLHSHGRLRYASKIAYLAAP